MAGRPAVDCGTAGTVSGRKGLLALAAVAGFLGLLLASVVALGVDPKPKADPAGPAKPDAKTAGNLAQDEQLLEGQFQELEKVLVRMRDLTKSSDPRRAVLIGKDP